MFTAPNPHAQPRSKSAYVPRLANLSLERKKPDKEILESFVSLMHDGRWKQVTNLLNLPFNYAKLHHPTTGFYPLHYLASMSYPNVDIIKLVAERYPRSLSLRTSLGLLPLHLSILRPNPNTDAIVALLDAESDLGVDFNASQVAPLPLHLSILHNAHEHAIMRVLYEYKTSTRFNCMGKTPSSRPSVRKAHAQMRNKLSTSDREIAMAGGLPLHLAIRFDASSAVVRAIHAAYPAGVQAMDDERRTPLHYLAMKGTNAEERLLTFAPPGGYPHLTREHLDTLTTILFGDSVLPYKSFRVAAKTKDVHGRVPLHYAILSRTYASPDPYGDTKRDDGETETRPLWKILLAAHPRACQFVDQNGMTPLHHAAQTMAKYTADAALAKDALHMFSAILKMHTAAAMVVDHSERLPLHYALQAQVVEGGSDSVYQAIKHLLAFTVGKLPAQPDLVNSLCLWIEERRQIEHRIAGSSSMRWRISKIDGIDTVGDMVHHMLGQAAMMVNRKGPSEAGRPVPNEGGIEALNSTRVQQKKRWYMKGATPLRYEYIPFGRTWQPNILAIALTQALKVLFPKTSVGEWSESYLRSIVWPVVLLQQTWIQRRVAFWMATQRDALHRRKVELLLSRLRDDLAAQLQGMNEKSIQSSPNVRAVQADPYFESFLQVVDQMQRDLLNSEMASMPALEPRPDAKPKHLLETAYMQAALVWERFRNFVSTVAMATNAQSSSQSVMSIHRACEVLGMGIGKSAPLFLVLKSKPICSTLSVSPKVQRGDADTILVVFSAVLLYKTMRAVREAIRVIVGLTHLVTLAAISNEFSITGDWRRLKLIMCFNKTNTYFELVLSHIGLAQSARTYSPTPPPKPSAKDMKKKQPAKPKLSPTFLPTYRLPAPVKKKTKDSKIFNRLFRQEQELEAAHAEVSALLLCCMRARQTAANASDAASTNDSASVSDAPPETPIKTTNARAASTTGTEGMPEDSRTKSKISQAQKLDALVNAPFEVGEVVFAQYHGSARSTPWQQATIIKQKIK